MLHSIRNVTGDGEDCGCKYEFVGRYMSEFVQDSLWLFLMYIVVWTCDLKKIMLADL